MKSIKFARKRLETADLAESEHANRVKSGITKIEHAVDLNRKLPFDEILELVELLNQKQQESKSSDDVASASAVSTDVDTKERKQVKSEEELTSDKPTTSGINKHSPANNSGSNVVNDNDDSDEPLSIEDKKTLNRIKKLDQFCIVSRLFFNFVLVKQINGTISNR